MMSAMMAQGAMALNVVHQTAVLSKTVQLYKAARDLDSIEGEEARLP